MSNKIKKSKIQSDKKRNRFWICAFGIPLAVIVLVIAVVIKEQTRETNVSVTLNSNGDFVVNVADIGNEFYNYDYGGEHDILIWKDGNGTVRTAFDTCEECFSTGNAHYEYENGVLVCQSCQTEFPINSFGNKSWGGCQPVAVATDYRTDTEEQIIIPAEVLNYANDVFEAWKAGDFTVTMENYSV